MEPNSNPGITPPAKEESPQPPVNNQPKQVHLPPNKMKTSKPWTKQAETYQLRNAFNASLAKLTSKETTEVGMGELKKIVAQNLDQKSLRVFLGALSNLDKNTSATAKEGQLEVLCLIVESVSYTHLTLPTICSV
eukprot:TRINITY_DN24977_c0_g1_i1.p1 TRINITY_DN24977_c0_g1~~TRINITY_DN24977_c0_g1_i1.p1  ORF type:complete len:135 (-),score=26.74 TRINITY_DN24977_c0_g1_i1:36-440(-)